MKTMFSVDIIWFSFNIYLFIYEKDNEYFMVARARDGYISILDCLIMYSHYIYFKFANRSHIFDAFSWVIKWMTSKAVPVTITEYRSITK